MSQKCALQTQYSNSLTQYLVKNKYFDKWTLRQINISWPKKQLQLVCTCTGKKKYYKLDQVSYTRDNQNKDCRYVKLKVCQERSYQIKWNQALEQLLTEIDLYFRVKSVGNFQEELGFPMPKKINYNTKINNISDTNCTNILNQDHSLIPIQKVQTKKLLPIPQKKFPKKKDIASYQRHSTYIKHSDWQRDPKNGGLLFINKQKKQLIPQMISYTAKKVVTSGQFSGINFPTFAMKGESMLESYCKCLGAAPLVLQKCGSQPVERMKAFNVIVLSLSIQLNDIEKSFNPLLGQTFQGQIGGNLVYAQQISTNPHISSFLLVGKDYKLSGSLQLKANIGLNQAIGVFHGQIKLQFDDGCIIIGMMPKGVMSGVLFGQTRFCPIDDVFCYDPKNKIVCSYETKKGDFMSGYIGLLKNHSYNKFLQFLNKKKYEDFQHLSQKHFQKIISKIQVIWSDSISYDGKKYFNYSDKSNLPIKITKNITTFQQTLLPSDSSHRKDISLRLQIKINQSQIENDRIQQQQERNKKMRNKWKHQHQKRIKIYHKIK